MDTTNCKNQICFAAGAVSAVMTHLILDPSLAAHPTIRRIA